MPARPASTGSRVVQVKDAGIQAKLGGQCTHRVGVAAGCAGRSPSATAMASRQRAA
ncbi:MAG: hypothetical protein R2854_19335 [Caldilineaceae bacterium]